MSLSLYDVTVPLMTATMEQLGQCLEKRRLHAEANGMSEEDLLGARLWPDMMSLREQVQRTSDTAKYAVVRVGGVETIVMEDDELGVADLRGRLTRTIEFLEAVPRSAFDGRDDAEVLLRTGKGTKALVGRSYVLEFSLPNFFFHVTTAYDLLRYKGVPIGKADFLGW